MHLNCVFFATIFRDAILSWDPQEDPMECENTSLHSDGPFLPQSPVGHLQQLFALMFYSKRRYIDPSPLIESLRLDTSTQQDAQVSILIFSQYQLGNIMQFSPQSIGKTTCPFDMPQLTTYTIVQFTHKAQLVHVVAVHLK